MKQHLCYVYGHESGHLLHELSEELVERKRLFCRELLGAFDVLAPGLSKERGLALFEVGKLCAMYASWRDPPPPPPS